VTSERAGSPDVAHVSATEASFSVGGNGGIIVKTLHGDFVLAVVLAAYEVVTEGFFDLVSSFVKEIFGILGSAVQRGLRLLCPCCQGSHVLLWRGYDGGRGECIPRAERDST
jgi:hypothetical protein